MVVISKVIILIIVLSIISCGKKGEIKRDSSFKNPAKIENNKSYKF